MDTVGLFDTELSEEEIAVEAVRALTCCHPGPHAALFVFPVNRRFTDEEYNCYTRMKNLLGENVTKKTIVVLTFSEIFDDEDATPEMFYRDATPKLNTVLQECGKREIFFSNKATGLAKTQQLVKLLQTIDSLGGIEYTESPYSKMTQQAVEKEIERRMLESSKLEAESNKYVKQVEEEVKVEKARTAEEKARADLEAKRAKEERCKLEWEIRQKAAQVDSIALKAALVAVGCLAVLAVVAAPEIAIFAASMAKPEDVRKAVDIMVGFITRGIPSPRT